LTRAFFVVNPAAANGRIKNEWASILETARAEYSPTIDFALTGGPGDGAPLAMRALKEGYDVVVSVGGDGTLNEVVNGFFEDDRPVNPSASLGVISLGTGGDFIRTLGISRDLHAYLETLKRANARAVDTVRSVVTAPDGSRKVRYFINVGEFGSGGAVVEKVNRTTKALGGRISFLWGILTTLPRYKNKEITYSVDGGDERTEVLNNFVVANGRFYGGGLKPAPEASLDDGQMDIVTMGDFRFREVLFSLGKLREGTHLSNPKVGFVRGRKVVARSEKKVLIEEDGELVGSLPAEFEIVPKSISLIC
jgi:YegS/Rv2252/BmrU family lipid kinase